MHIEVIYAPNPQTYKLISLQVAEGTSIEKAICLSGMLQLFPEINLAVNKVGIYGKIKQLDEVVAEGDRIEIYRPLLVDPKEARRLRDKAHKLKLKNL